MEGQIKITVIATGFDASGDGTMLTWEEATPVVVDATEPVREQEGLDVPTFIRRGFGPKQ
jgi:hypothetical protein